ncbi:class I SAM-dependent methyltransferase [Streptomyces sp. 8N706]|uniref:class I SAM-dependent methyltransferase n=1 Tax=Streptomyces sp. 8N706 TaxID=3457416 RepID=UPI003FD3C7F9
MASRGRPVRKLAKELRSTPGSGRHGGSPPGDPPVRGLRGRSFDLIHARAVLCHLPARDEVLARAFEWLTPGGWLLVEDVYTLPVGSSPYAAMNRYAKAAQNAAQMRGADMQWGNRVPGILATLGFGHVAAEAKPRLVGTGGLPDDLWRINLKQAGRRLVSDGLLTQDDLDECLALLDNPSFVVSGISASPPGDKNRRRSHDSGRISGSSRSAAPGAGSTARSSRFPLHRPEATRPVVACLPSVVLAATRCGLGRSWVPCTSTPEAAIAPRASRRD